MLNTKIIDFHKGEFDYMCLEEITVNSRDAIIIMKIIFIQPECWCNKIRSIFKKEDMGINYLFCGISDFSNGIKIPIKVQGKTSFKYTEPILSDVEINNMNGIYSIILHFDDGDIGFNFSGAFELR